MIDVPSIVNFIVIVAGLAAVGAIIWNASRKSANMESKLNQVDKKQDRDITELRREHNNDIAELRKQLSDAANLAIKEVGEHRVEYKEEITKAIINQHERLEVLQRQIDSTKSDVKDLSTRITVSGTKSDQFDKEIERVCKETVDNKIFFVDWIQRVEDRIKETNNYIFDLFRRSDDKDITS